MANNEGDPQGKNPGAAEEFVGKELGRQRTQGGGVDFRWATPEGTLGEEDVFGRTAGAWIVVGEPGGLPADVMGGVGAQLTPAETEGDKARYQRWIDEMAARLGEGTGRSPVAEINTTDPGEPLVSRRHSGSGSHPRVVFIGGGGAIDYMEMEGEIRVTEPVLKGKPVIFRDAGGTKPPVVRGEQDGPATLGTVLPGAGEIILYERPDPFRVKDRQAAPGTGSATAAEQVSKPAARRRPRRPSQG